MQLRLLAYFIIVMAVIYGVTGCHNNKQPSPETTISTTPKGEFAFLLKYNGQMPSDVGFLTNHVVERRLANILKDSFAVFISKAMYDRPIMVSEEEKLVSANFYSDSDRINPIANVVIDVGNDAVWVSYVNGDSLLEFTDHPSLTRPGP